MKKERKSLIFSMFINLTVSILKIIGGLFLGSYTLVTTSYYTLCDFAEETLAFIGSLIGHKRANKKHKPSISYIHELLLIELREISFLFLEIEFFILREKNRQIPLCITIRNSASK